MANNQSSINYSWNIDLTGIISSPTTSGIFNFSTWPDEIEGIASSNGSFDDLSLVEIKVQKNSENKYLGYATSTLDWLDQPTWLETILNENNWHFDLPVSLLTDSSYFISSRATDLVGNIQNTTSTTEFIFDTTPPEKVNNLKTENLGGLNLKLSWDEVIDNLSGIDHYEVNWGQNTTSTTVNNFELSVQDRETYNFKVRAVDKAGNTGEWSDEVSYFVKLPSIVISEVQIAGKTADEEFIELYNPTDQAINLTDWKLTKKTASGTESTILSNKTKTKFTGIIPAQGYFLISNPNSSFVSFSDLVYGSSQSIASNNTVILYNPEEKIIDKVGWGTASDFESAPAAVKPELLKNQSIERYPGYPNGNQQDTDNNANDFFVQLTPNPISSKGPWLNTWQKRKLLVIDNTQNNNDLTNFCVDVDIAYDPDMKNDFSDIRFTDSNGTTLLKFGWDWNDDGTEKKTNGQSVTALVKIPNIPAYSKVKIYMYYENTNASSASDLWGLSSAVEGNWFDDTKINRLKYYTNYQNGFQWEQGEDRVYRYKTYPWGTHYALEIPLFSQKNIIAKIITRWYEAYNNPLESRIQYRYTDTSNNFQVYTSAGDALTKWAKTINNLRTVLGTGLASARYVTTLNKIECYETSHKIEVKYPDSTILLSTDTIESDQNVTGGFGLFLDGATTNNDAFYVYKIYIRQNTEAMPTVSFGE